MTLEQRYDAILDYFRKNVPVAESELHFDSDYELLVSVILSAQCTDKRVNLVTPALFAAYPTVEALSKATAEVLSGAKKSYKLLLDLEPEKLDEIVSKLNPDVAQKLLSSEHGTEKEDERKAQK